jgi:ubiquinol-cytochrome c reductase cytochrome c1 subunit
MPAWADDYPIKLEKAYLNTHDIESIQRGAKNFAHYCLACHSLEYLDHDPIARQAGITPAKMPSKNRQWWFGAAPPDLSLAAKVHGSNWLYTYLHAFYVDPTRPNKSNNLLIDNSNMPNPFLGLQGEQVLLVNKKKLFDSPSFLVRKLPYYSVLNLTRKGTMEPDHFDDMTRDLINFLTYASEPKKYARERLGIWVLIFIAILYVFIYLLKKEYWKKILKQS